MSLGYIRQVGLQNLLLLINADWVTEINALEMRTKGASLAMATNWICHYAVVQATLPGIASLGYKFWIVWAAICGAVSRGQVSKCACGR